LVCTQVKGKIMAQLHPQEIYILEYLSSLEHFCNVRDNLKKAVHIGEQALDEFMHHIPAKLRQRHLSEQPDVVWGGLVLPNLRSSLDSVIRACVLRSHNEPEAFRYIGAWGSNTGKNIKDYYNFGNGWMPKAQEDLFWDSLELAMELDGLAGATISGSWEEGDLTHRLDFSDKMGLIYGTGIALPAQIPAYELDHSVVIKLGEPVKETGIYLPEAENTAAQFLNIDIFDYDDPSPWVRQGLVKDSYGDWRESQPIKTSWTLVRRIPDQFIEVPAEGFFPKQGVLSQGRAEALQPCPQTGWWWTPARAHSRQHFIQGATMPDFPYSAYGATIWYRDAKQS
jgi:hypothetical protein